MKPAPFRYARPATAAEAVTLLAAARGDAKLLAGGPLEVHHIHQNPLARPVDADRRVRSQLVFANAAHCCLVEIDPHTGQIALRKYVVVHDCGHAALLEEFHYDEAGQLLTSTFMDYLKPTAADVPTIEVDRLEHPSPVTSLGAKGVGEGGSIPGPAAVANAVEGALAHLGVVVRSLPITPEQVWRWLRAGSG
jgi:2-furoyl-CoA dehydrogenase large subunit